MFGLFLVTVSMMGGAVNAGLSCQDAGIEMESKACVEYVWENREGVPITQEVYKQRFND